MDVTQPISAEFSRALPGDTRHGLIVSTYFKGATVGKGLGTAGYSYEFVRQLFAPLMKRWGEVVFVKNAVREVEPVGRQMRDRNLTPIHVSFVACQDLYLSPSMSNVVVPAWEFPDVPGVPFDDNPQNDWIATSNRCDLVIAHVPFTARALIASGVTVPVREVPVPMPAEYFAVPMRSGRAEETVIEAAGYSFAGAEPKETAGQTAIALGQSRSVKASLRASIRSGLGIGKKTVKRLTPDFIWSSMQLVKSEYRRQKAIKNIDHPLTSPIPLSGVVYTSIFNPADGRKNWRDLITGFVAAMKDCDDATLVLKLVTRDPEFFYDVFDCYRKTTVIPHRCKVVMIRDYLSDEQMMNLLRASSYYVTTTRAEGNCLPLMNYLAAGRPGISPSHSAIGDYFDDEVGFVVDSYTTPAYWPQELRPKYRTSWNQMIWPSFVEQLRQSYRIAKHDRRAYERLSQNARSRMFDWLSEERVYPLLRDALDVVAGRGTQESTTTRRAA